MGRNVTLAAACLVVLGVTLLLGPTFGFSTIAGDRGVSISTAPDNSAIIALNGTDYEELNDDEFTTIGTLENNAVGPLGITYELRTDHDRVDLQFDGQTGDPVVGSVDVESGGAEEIGFQCGPPGQMQGPVTVTAEIIEASGSGIVISDAEMDLVVSCDGEVADDGDAEFVYLNIEVETHHSNDKLDRVTIEWEIDDTEDVDYVQIYTSYTDIEEINPDAGHHEIDNFKGNEIPFDVTVDIDGGERCTMTFEEGGSKTLEDCG